MTYKVLHGSAAVLICSLTPAVQAVPLSDASAAPTECRAPKPKKHPFGLGGLLSAARRAGVGDMLNNRMGGGMFGNGKGGQIAGAIAGTAVEAVSANVPTASTDQSAAEAASCTPAQGGDQ